MSTHTEGKLATRPGGFLVDAEDVCIAVTSSPDTDNARRLAACWNVCLGLTTNDVEILVRGGGLAAALGFHVRVALDDNAEILRLKAEIAAATATGGPG